MVTRHCAEREGRHLPTPSGERLAQGIGDSENARERAARHPQIEAVGRPLIVIAPGLRQRASGVYSPRLRRHMAKWLQQRVRDSGFRMALVRSSAAYAHNPGNIGVLAAEYMGTGYFEPGYLGMVDV